IPAEPPAIRPLSTPAAFLSAPLRSTVETMTWSRGLSLIIASLAVALGCTRRLSPTEQNPPVARIVVQPETLTVDPGQQIQYAAYGRTAAGDSTAVAVTWSAAPGAISAGGLYTADTAAAGGDFQVTASNTSLGLSATSHGHVRKRAVASVTV